MKSVLSLKVYGLNIKKKSVIINFISEFNPDLLTNVDFFIESVIFYWRGKIFIKVTVLFTFPELSDLKPGIRI